MGRRSERIYNKKIMNKINTAVRRSIKDYSGIIYDRMKQNFDNAIDVFYNDYTPQTKYTHGTYITQKSDGSGFKTHFYKYWKRKYSLYKALYDNKKKSIEYITDGDIYGFKITLSISGSNIKIKHHNDVQYKHDKWKIPPNQWIFDRAYIQGIHGFTVKDNIEWFNKSSVRHTPLTMWHHNYIQFNPGAIESKRFTLVRKPLPNNSVPKVNLTKDGNKNVRWIVKKGITQIRKDIRKERLPFDLIMKYFK